MITVVTGGIGSGKSAVIDILKTLGKVVVKADEINAELLKDSEYLSLLEKNFKSAFKSGALDKKLLKEIVFNNEKKRIVLNGLAHPLIVKRINEISKLHSEIYIEVPLMEFQSEEKIQYDRIWLITSDINKRKERISLRDNIESELACKIIESQKICKNTHFDEVIENNYDLSELKRKVLELI